MATTIDTTASFITDINDVRRHLSLPIDDHEYDGVLIAMVNHCATLFERYTGRKLKERAYTDDLHDGTGLTTMHLKQWPVDRLQTFTVNSDVNRLFTSDDLVFWNDSGDPTSADFMLDDETGELEMLAGKNWPKGRKTVKVTYTAGIKTADAGHIIHAALTQISSWWAERGKELLSGWNMGGNQETVIADILGQGRWRAIHPTARITLLGECRQEFD